MPALAPASHPAAAEGPHGDYDDAGAAAEDARALPDRAAGRAPTGRQLQRDGSVQQRPAGNLHRACHYQPGQQYSELKIIKQHNILFTLLIYHIKHF